MTSTADRPWSATIRLDEIGEAGREVEIEASEETRVALAHPAGVDVVERLVGRFNVSRRGRDGLHVSGSVSARVRQTCVVTLEVLFNDIDEPVDVDFAPTREVEAAATEVDLAMVTADEPEPLIGNAVDLGLLATEFLILAIDPYPRKPGASFDAPAPTSDPAAHPFAGLAALQKNSTVKK